MGALLRQPAGFEHVDAIARSRLFQAVRDADRCVTAAQRFERGIDGALGRRVERARGLVEQQDVGPAQQRTRDGNALALTAGQTRTAGAQSRVVALGQGLDEGIGLGQPRSFLDFLIARI